MASLSLAHVARRAGISATRARRLAEAGLLQADADGRYLPSAVQHVRLAQTLERTGISIEIVGQAIASGRVTFNIIDQIFEDPAAMADETLRSMSHRVGVTVRELQRIFLALGLPLPEADRRIREDDARNVERLLSAWQAGDGVDFAVRYARLVGMPMRQMAEAGVQLFDEALIQPLRRSDRGRDPAAGDRANAVGIALIGASYELVDWLARRHVEEALLSYWTIDAEEALPRDQRPAADRAMAFVDLAGFTELTEREGDVAAGQLAERLTDLAEEQAASHRGRVVKLLGDGVMLHFRRARDAVDCALELVVSIPQAGLPAVHVGIDHGPLLERDGDYFGRTVNVASRLAGLAEPGQVLASPRVAGAAQRGVFFESLGRRAVRGVGEMEIFAASPVTGRARRARRRPGRRP